MGLLDKIKELMHRPGAERRQIIESYRQEFQAYDSCHLQRISRAAATPEVRRAAAAVLRERERSK